MPKKPWIIYLSKKCKILFCNHFYVKYCLFLFSMLFNQPLPLSLYHSLACQVIKYLLQIFFSLKTHKMIGMFWPIYVYICAAWWSNYSGVLKPFLKIPNSFRETAIFTKWFLVEIPWNTVFLSQIWGVPTKNHFWKIALFLKTTWIF